MSVSQIQKPLRQARSILRYSGNTAVTALYPDDTRDLFTHFRTFRLLTARIDQPEVERIYMTLDSIERVLNDTTKDKSGMVMHVMDKGDFLQRSHDDVVACIDECVLLAPYFEAEQRQTNATTKAAPTAPRRPRPRT